MPLEGLIERLHLQLHANEARTADPDVVSKAVVFHFVCGGEARASGPLASTALLVLTCSPLERSQLMALMS